MVIDLFADVNKPGEYNREIIAEAEEIKQQLAAAYSQFNYSTDSVEIEASIYRIKFLETQYRHLINTAKINKYCNMRKVEIKKI